jgi:hypothetical protein
MVEVMLLAMLHCPTAAAGLFCRAVSGERIDGTQVQL